MTKQDHIIIILFSVFLALLSLHGQANYAPTRGKNSLGILGLLSLTYLCISLVHTKRPINVETCTSISLQPLQSDDHSFLSSCQHAIHLAAHEATRGFSSWSRAFIGIPANTSFSALLLTKRTEAAERFHSVFDEARRTYHIIQEPVFSPSTREAELEEIATSVGVSYEEVSGLTIILVERMLWVMRLYGTVSEVTSRCAHYLWRRFVLGLWREKLAIGFTFLVWACVCKAWKGRRLEAAGIAVVVLLFWPLCALLEPVIVN